MAEKTALEQVKDNIAQYCREFSRDANDVKLVAVSKTKPVGDIAALVSQGQMVFGENYLQEALGKVDELANSSIEWHYIGAIQSRKAKQIALHFDWVHTVDRITVAQKLNEARQGKPALNILVQVNIQHEVSKAGVLPDDLMKLVTDIKTLPNLLLKGLMLIPEAQTDFESQRAVFAKAKALLNSLHAIAPEMTELSMGMTGDMRAAIAEGATMVRIGTALFGARNYD